MESFGRMRDYYDILRKNKINKNQFFIRYSVTLDVFQNTKLQVFLVLCSRGTLFLPEIKAGEFVLYYNTHKHEFHFNRNCVKVN